MQKQLGWVWIILIAVIILIGVIFVAIQARSAENPGVYSEWARRGLVKTFTANLDSAETDTLVIFDLAGQEASNAIVDSVREEHNVGAEYWTLILRVRNTLARLDSVWCRLYGESGAGPIRNPDGSMCIISSDSSNDRYNVWGTWRFETLDTTREYVEYKLPFYRARGTGYIFGRAKHTKTYVTGELWKGSDR